MDAKPMGDLRFPHNSNNEFGGKMGRNMKFFLYIYEGTLVIITK